MLKLLSILMFVLLFPLNALACYCAGNCLQVDYDLAAVIEITEKNSSYADAFNAKVLDLKGWQKEAVENPSPMFDLLVRKIDTIVVVTNGVHKPNVRAVSSCNRYYRVGQKMFFFAKEVAPGFYQSDQCTCTTYIK